MFGMAVACLSTIDDAEKARYRHLYCGLCHALKERYGTLSRLCLTYDLTFYIMLCDSLHEPPEHHGRARCAMHPASLHDFARSRYTDYAADLSVALAYHKCLDDWNDDKSVRAKVTSAALDGAYRAAARRIPDQCSQIERSLADIAAMERADDTAPHAAAREFGRLLGELFAADQGVWESPMRAFGQRLGAFVYLMDAAVDCADDAASGSYNPFVRLESTPESMRTILGVVACSMTEVFERLPLERDLHLMRSVLYAGVWQKFNAQYPTEDNHD